MHNADESYRRGQEHAAAGDWSTAVRAYAEALAADKTYWKARFGRGLAYHRLGKLKAALKDLNQVVSVSPRCAEAHYCRASVLYEMEYYRDACEDCSAALQLRSEYVDALYVCTSEPSR
jgi:tetratricopeptide (TPR) repeat protein